jgi:hypothetical protein
MQYIPTSEEIDAIVARGITKHPSLAARWGRAAAILSAAPCPVFWTGSEWICTSSDGRREYQVGFEYCHCPDSERRTDLVEGVAFCKHRLALLAYREICAYHLQTRCLGTYRSSSDFRRLQRELNAGLLITDKRQVVYCPHAGAHIPTTICIFRSSPRGVTPATPVDLGRFAAWLAYARPLSPTAAASILFNQLVAAGKDRTDAAAAADLALCDAYDARP